MSREAHVRFCEGPGLQCPGLLTPHLSSQRFSQLCFWQRPHGPLCCARLHESVSSCPQSARHRSMQLGPCSVVVVVMQLSTHDGVHVVSHSVLALAVHDVSQSL